MLNENYYKNGNNSSSPTKYMKKRLNKNMLDSNFKI